ncbi:MAG: NAD(+) synthase [Clostridiales bacterium]|nr:NAD(+) synthase [Clostridiales bacterium]
MINESKKIIEWIKNYVTNCKAKGIAIGMSGGKDSLVVAKLCADALGKDNVLGVIMPNGEMTDITDAIDSCKLLRIDYQIIDISTTYKNIIEETQFALISKNTSLNSITTINTPPRIRMTILYAIAGSLNYLVANTSNLSEIMVGYSTKWGDSAGDIAPIANYTKSEVCEIGLALGLPKELVIKTSSDGLSGKSDEEKLGFTYNELDNLIRTGEKGENYDKIITLHNTTNHKRNPIPKPQTSLKNYLNN